MTSAAVGSTLFPRSWDHSETIALHRAAGALVQAMTACAEGSGRMRFGKGSEGTRHAHYQLSRGSSWLGQWLGKDLGGKFLVSARVGLTVHELTGGLVYGHRTACPGMRNELVK